VHCDLAADTPFWGYEGQYPGPTIEVPRDLEVVVTFINRLVPPSDPMDPRTQWPFAIARDVAGGMPYLFRKALGRWFICTAARRDPNTTGGPTMRTFPASRPRTTTRRKSERRSCGTTITGDMITRLKVYAGLAELYVVRDPAVENQLPE
jgi:hypothetical protein